MLPDGRTINLVPTGEGYWGGNFEIPADSPEGDYAIRVYSMNKDGSTTIQQIVYTVDRTPPVGTASVVRMFGNLMLVVRSEAKLAKVFAVALNGAVIELKETSPGVYIAALPNDAGGELRITMLDGAHNRGEILCRY